MDDSLTVEVYKLEIDGSYFVTTRLTDIFTEANANAESLELGEELEMKLSLVKMSGQEYNSLPDFDGF